MSDTIETPMAKLTIDPIVYEVGRDVTRDQYEALIVAIGDWFRMRAPNKPEPAKRAKRYIDACLLGVKPTDKSAPWATMATATLSNRIRVACRWDMDAMKPLFKDSERKKVKQAAREQRAVDMVRNKADDPYVPETVRLLARKQTVYGDDPKTFLSPKEHQKWNELHAAYTEQFPQLANINAAAELDLLCDLLVANERLRFKMLNGEKVDFREFDGSIENINKLKKMLGIHPDQLSKRLQETQEGSFTQLLARVQGLPNFRELREAHWTEEMLQLFQMYQQPSLRTDMGGYQLDEVGLMGMTGCRTCACSGCGQRNFVGLKIDEIETYLVMKDVLEVSPEPEPAPPTGPVTWQDSLEWEPSAAERAELEAEMRAHDTHDTQDEPEVNDATSSTD